jgi:hypothetical protein
MTVKRANINAEVFSNAAWILLFVANMLDGIAAIGAPA